MRWALFWMLYGSFQALQQPLGVFLIYGKATKAAPISSNAATCFADDGTNSFTLLKSPQQEEKFR